MSWVYIQSERGDYPLWTVGHYDPAGKWQPESDHGTAEEAAARVRELNGGTADHVERFEAFRAGVSEAMREWLDANREDCLAAMVAAASSSPRRPAEDRGPIIPDFDSLDREDIE